jgi:phosphatidylinositol alpha-1,6-mannosyltransferase
VSRVIADCHFTANYVLDEGLLAEAPAVVWDPIDLDRFIPGSRDPDIIAKYKLPDPERNVVIMSLGRLAKEAAHKGFDRLILNVARIAPQLPNLRLVIAGRGDDRPRLEKLCSSYGIADRVTFAGSITEQDLAAVYRCAHIFSLVSDRGHGRGEGLPLTPLEAMACGVPIVVGNEDGSQEAVVDGRNGFVVSPRSADAHGAILAKLAADADLRRKLGIQARAVAIEQFSFQGFAEKHRALLRSIVPGKVDSIADAA